MNFGSKINLRSKINFGSKIKFESKIKFGSNFFDFLSGTIFGSEKNCGSKNFFGKNKCWVWKNVGSEKSFGFVKLVMFD